MKSGISIGAIHGSNLVVNLILTNRSTDFKALYQLPSTRRTTLTPKIGSYDFEVQKFKYGF